MSAWAHRLIGVPLAVTLVGVLALIDISAGPSTVLAGLMVVGPATAAVSAGPRAVVAVGAWSLALILALAGPDNLWGTRELAYFVAATVVVTALSAYTASNRTHLTGETERLAAIVESSADPVVGKALDGTIVSWNAAAERTFGWRADETVGQNIRMMVPDELQGELDEIMSSASRGEAVEHYVTQRMTKDSRRLDISVTTSPIRDPAGRVVGISAMGRDVTDALAAASAVQASEARKSAILAGALDAVVTIDHNGIVLEVNRAMTTTFGWTEDQMVGRELAELVVPEESRSAHRSGIAAYLHTGYSPLVGARLELTAMRKDGTRIPVEVTVTRVDLPGDPVFTGYLRDMSAHRAAEEEANRLRDRLRQSERLDSLGQLAGGIAHDFNNLLAVILNYAALVRDGLPESEVREDVDAISAAAQRAAGLTRQLLTFSRGDQGELAVTNPNAVVGQVSEVLRRTLYATIKVVTRLTPEAWPVHCDTTRLDQVVMNLAVNARDAMPDGGTLTIETSNVHLDELAASNRVLLRPGHYLRLTVSDTGTGMTPEVQERAFDPFFTTKPPGQGTGLGLATVYGIARQMDGEISIYSEVGRGTSIRIYLPVADEHVSTPQPAVDQVRTAVGSGRQLLLVEDEEMLREALDRTLAAAGFLVRVAGSAEDALELAAASMPDLLVTDVTLPGMSGPDLALRLRARRPDLPVLLMSGYAAHRLPDGLAGSAVLIDKPFPIKQLLDRVAELLGGTAAGSRR